MILSQLKNEPLKKKKKKKRANEPLSSESPVASVEICLDFLNNNVNLQLPTKVNVNISHHHHLWQIH